MRLFWRFGPLITSTLLLALSGCERADEPDSCGALPEPTACPLSRGGSCDDRSCSAVYSCQAGSWSLLERCQPSPADAGPGDGGDGGDGGVDGASGSEGGCQLPPGPPVSCPTLEPPECDARLIDGCDQGVCDTGCEVFLRCQGGDWQAAYAGYCVDGGLVRP